MGSGKVINCAISKYGIDNFTKVILEIFDTSDAMYAKEKEVVNDEFLARPDVYNIRRGGYGGFDYINSAGLAVQNLKNPEVRKKTHESFNLRLATDGPTQKEIAHHANLSNIVKQQYALDFKKSVFETLNHDAAFQEKRKAAFAASGHAKGEKNSQFGSRWITNGILNKKISKLDSIPEGWVLGRKMK